MIHKNLIIGLVHKHYNKGINIALLYGHYNKYMQEQGLLKEKISYEEYEKQIQNWKELKVIDHKAKHGTTQEIKPR